MRFRARPRAEDPRPWAGARWNDIDLVPSAVRARPSTGFRAQSRACYRRKHDCERADWIGAPSSERESWGEGVRRSLEAHAPDIYERVRERCLYEPGFESRQSFGDVTGAQE